jgi:hypothetical protein
LQSPVRLPGIPGSRIGLRRDIWLFHLWAWLRRDGGRRSQASAARRNQWWSGMTGRIPDYDST